MIFMNATRVMKDKSELDKFTAEIQKKKMQEIWGNPEDEERETIRA